MDDQFTLPSLTRAISNGEIEAISATLIAKVQQALVSQASSFLELAITPLRTHDFECQIEIIARELGRSFLEWCFGAIEPENVESMPGSVRFKDHSFRRLIEKTVHSNILTRFGKIKLSRATYRRGRSGKVIAPVEKMLGIQFGATPAAADLVGRQIAATGSSQTRSIEFIADRTGAKIGNEKLRSISSGLFDSMEPHRAECQLEQLQKWIDQAVKHGKDVVLSISRDGVSLCIAPYGYFEMASVATLSVFSQGNRIGTVYLAATPEENQTQLSENLTSLLSNVVCTRGAKISKIAYVTDAGIIETAYWKTTLRKFYVGGKRIKIDRTVDYYHASLRLTAIADSLKLNEKARQDWLESVRKLLLLDGGWGRVMRSVAKMKELHGLKGSAVDEYKKAEKYLRRYRRYMNYAEQRGNGCPIGSGIVESACKQIVTERLKLSGMRWKHAGARQIMTLRSILLSQTWTATYKRMLENFSPVEPLYAHPAQ
jgi:hypothetical protein